MSSSGPGDEQQPPQWQQPQWQQSQQDQPQWGGQQQQQWQGQGQQTPGSATASLILGICALLICPIICGPLALVYGNRAKSEIDSSGGRLGGRGLATAGVILGWIGIAYAIIMIIIVIAIAASGSG